MANIRIANAPCSWGSLEFEGLEGEAIGYRQMLDELVETGYHGTELGDWGYLPTSATELHEELSQRDLTLLGAFVPVDLSAPNGHEESFGEVRQIARLLAGVAVRSGQAEQPFLVLADDNGTDATRTRNAGRVRGEMGLRDEQWETFVRNAEAVAIAVRDWTGLPTVFHHHCAGYVETPDEIAQLMERTNPDLLGLVFDTGHFAYAAGAGTDVNETMMDCLERFADRIPYVHLKDCHPQVAESARSEQWDYFEAVRRGVFCELGRGCVDFPAVVKWLKDRDYDGWAVVEQDVLPGMGTPKESARHNRDYLLSIGV